MESMPKLNLPPINLRAKSDCGRTLVFDDVRSAYVVLTPEEWVRRHLVSFLVRHCGAPLRSIIEEYPVCINSMPQRADVVVMDSEARPLILVECKATDIDLTNRKTLGEVFEQATRYNAVVGARYLILSNGLQHFCFERSTEGYTPLRSFPRVG